MEIKSIKATIKKYYEEHKTACKIAGVAGLVVVGEIVGWKWCCKANGFKPGRYVVTDEMTNLVLDDMCNVYKGSLCSKLLVTADTPI